MRNYLHAHYRIVNTFQEKTVWQRLLIRIKARCLFKEPYYMGGETTLQEISRHEPVLRNRVTSQIEQAVAEIAIANPACDQLRIANELKKRGPSVSTAVRNFMIVWSTLPLSQ